MCHQPLRLTISAREKNFFVIQGGNLRNRPICFVKGLDQTIVCIVANAIFEKPCLPQPRKTQSRTYQLICKKFASVPFPCTEQGPVR